MGERICAVPGCDRALSPGNSAGVCRDHTHARPWCGCRACRPGYVKPRYRVKTRAERVAEGLLPGAPRRDA